MALEFYELSKIHGKNAQEIAQHQNLRVRLVLNRPFLVKTFTHN